MAPVPAEIRFVLVRPREPGNIGAATRAIASMGFDSLWLVAPERYPHPEVSIRAAEAADVVANIRVCNSLGEALADCDFAAACSARRRHNRWPVLEPAQACGRLLECPGPAALVFGPESSGLSNEELQQCQIQTSIPMAPGRHSLNLSHAVQVYAFELQQALSRDPGLPAKERPTAEQLRSLLKQWEDLASAAGMAPPSPQDQRLAALLHRADASRRDWALLAGLARRLLDRLSAPGDSAE